MSVLGVIADGFAAAADAGGLVAFGLVTGMVIAGALRRTALAEVCAVWGLGFIAAYLMFAALGGELAVGAGGLLALIAAVAVGVALSQGISAPWVAGAAVALWALCALRANAAADGDTLLRVVVWCSSAAVLATLALRVEEALAPPRQEAAATPRAAASGPDAAPPGRAAAEPEPASAPPAAGHAFEPPAAGDAGLAFEPPPVVRQPEPVALVSTHLWSADGYREATSRAPS
jgi:hypothetical protein